MKISQPQVNSMSSPSSSLLMLLFLWTSRSSSGFVHSVVPTLPSLPTVSQHVSLSRNSLLSMSTASPPEQQNQQVDLLKSKLKILEDVVKELHHRETEQSQKHLLEIEKLQLQQKQHDSTESNLTKQIDELKANLKQKRKRHDDEIQKIIQEFKQKEESMESKLKANLEKEKQGSGEELQNLKKEFQEKEEAMERTFVNLQTRLSKMQTKHEEKVAELERQSASRQEEMERLTSKYEEKMISSKSEIKRLQKLVETESKDAKSKMEEKYESKLEFKKQQLHDLQTKLEDTERNLQEKLNAANQEKEEQIEIAAAAVSAAETNVQKAKAYTGKVAKQLRQALFFQKLLWLCVDSLSDVESKEELKPSTADGLVRAGQPGSRNRILIALNKLRASYS